MLKKTKVFKLRKQYFSASYSLSYREPLYIVQGEKQFLYDNKGKRYLDAVNNIQHVGHSHPKVLEAATKQLKRLNTNTRYLNDVVSRYAEKLIKKMPGNLNTCFFTNSGSESNDLALRIAKIHTDGDQTIVLDGAYHGHLTSLIEISKNLSFYIYPFVYHTADMSFLTMVFIPTRWGGPTYKKNTLLWLPD